MTTCAIWDDHTIALDHGVIYIHHNFQMASVAEIAGVGKKTPMAVILSEWGVEPDLKYLS